TAPAAHRPTTSAIDIARISKLLAPLFNPQSEIHNPQSQHGPPPSTLKNDSMSASVPISPSALKSAEPQVLQQLPPRQAKKASMSASVPMSPLPSKSAVLQLGWKRSEEHTSELQSLRHLVCRL